MWGQRYLWQLHLHNHQTNESVDRYDRYWRVWSVNDRLLLMVWIDIYLFAHKSFLVTMILSWLNSMEILSVALTRPWKIQKLLNLHTFFWINAILWCEMQTFSEWIYFFVCLFVCLGISIDFYISMERGLVLKCHNSMEIRYINAELRQTAHHNIHRLTDANTIHALSLQKLVDSQ